MSGKEIAGFENVDKFAHGDLFEFLSKSFAFTEIAGQRIIQTPDGLFVEHVLMEEEYFVQNWLTQFAIGHAGEKNYFDMETWNQLTDNFTKGVIVINEDRHPVLIIRKFTEMVLPDDLMEKLAFCSNYASKAKFVTDEAEKTALIKQFAEQVNAITTYAGVDEDSLTSLIPPAFFEKHGIHPLTMKQLIYIRDTYKVAGQSIDPDSDIFKRLESVITRFNKGEKVNDQDKKFVLEITQNEFLFDYEDHSIEEPISIEKTPSEPEDFDPLAD